MTTILAAVDDSAAATPVLETALALAPIFGADVQCVQVAETLGRTGQAAAEALGTSLRAIDGDPLDVLVGLAARDDTVAIVVGSRDRPGGPRPAGHLALALAGVIAKPVVLVPPDLPHLSSIRRAVIALSGTTRSRRYLQRAVELAAATGLDLVVVHVDDEDTIPSFSDQAQYDNEVYAAEFLARFCPGAPDARLEMRMGSPADEILAAAHEAGADLVAVGWPQSDDPARGAVAKEIVERCHLPVLLVALADGPV